MNTRVYAATAILVGLLSSVAVLAETHCLVVDGEELEFVPAPERGYVVKLAERTGSVTALSGISMLDAKDATPVRGLDRHGVWIVENDDRADRNKASIRSLSAGGQVAYAAPLFSSNGETVAIIPEIVVRAKPGVEMDEVQRLCETAGCTIRKPMEFTTREYLLEVLGPDAEAVFDAIETLSRDPQVEWACPNIAFQPRLAGQTALEHGTATPAQMASAGGDPNTLGAFPDDEYFPLQWHLHNAGQSGGTPGVDIKATEAWELTTGDPNIVVAVLDSGVEMKHPDLINNLVQGYDFVHGDNIPEPVGAEWINAHGTVCAGLIAAQGNNGVGVTGVTWNSKIMPIAIATWPNPGLIASSEIATAFRWAAANGADVLSNSWVMYVVSPIIYSAIVDVTARGGIGRGGKGCVVIAAAGNDGGPVLYPAAYAEVVAIGATNHNDLRWYYSNRGPNLDLMAPSGGLSDEDWLLTDGKDWMWTTDITGVSGFSEWNSEDGWESEMFDYNAGGGTSSACPVAAGVAALILSLEPDLTNREVQHFLERSAKDLGDPGRDDYYGWGRVDARAALDIVLAKRADLNDDWRVDLEDLVILIESWETDDVLADIAPATKRDGFVDEQDLELLLRYWQVEIPEMDVVAN